MQANENTLAFSINNAAYKDSVALIAILRVTVIWLHSPSQSDLH